MIRSDGIPPEYYDLGYLFGLIYHRRHPGTVLVRTRLLISSDGITVVDLVRNWGLHLRGIQTTHTRSRLELK